ncbi:MAG: sphingosine N-acyltransferase lag1 [Piccolia ochrophora]|nr:MAG: sphingosine N-acyltransferase lag1 [Piccolia ochrophora]
MSTPVLERAHKGTDTREYHLDQSYAERVHLQPKIQDQSGNNVWERRNDGKPKTRRKEDSLLAVTCAWIVEHQIGLATNLIILLALTHLCLPRARQHTRKFIELSYFNPKTGKYTVGWDDTFMVVYWIVVFTGLRAGVMDFVLVPFARWGGVEKKKGRIRFAEQAWLFMYYEADESKYIFYESPYWLNLRELWTDWPNTEIDGLLKWYYLVQFAFWIQQIIVVNIEERRKDYHQMLTHHLITCALILGSYSYLHTRVGNVILCIMDVVDLVFPLAKMLKYLHFHVACDFAFVAFMLTWFIARHVFYLMVCWSVYTDVPAAMPYGCYSGTTGERTGPAPETYALYNIFQPLRDPSGTVCFNKEIKYTFLTMLLALQVITLMWFGMILRVAWRVVNGGTAEDSRSDDEGDGEEADSVADAKDPLRVRDAVDPAPLEQEVGVEAINLKGRTSPARRYRKAASSSSGVTLPGHSDRKELLGRIGCDKTS